MNAQGLRSVEKQRLLRGRLIAQEGDIIAVAETFLSSDHPDSLLVSGTDYSVFRRDRVGRTGGGVALFIRRTLNPRPVSLSFDVEMVAIDISGDGYDYRFVCLYKPPNAKYAYVKTMCEALTHLASTRHHLFILGDMNFPCLKGLPANSANDSIFHDLASELFKATVFQLSLTQINFHPSREANENILDLILVSSDIATSLSEVICSEPLGRSDHFCLTVRIPFSAITPLPPRFFRNFKKGDYESAIAFLLDVDWDFYIANSPTIQEFSDHFTSILISAIETFVPLRKAGVKSSLLPPYLMRLRNKVKLTFKARKSRPEPYSESKKKFSSALRRLYSSQEDALLSANSMNEFYGMVRRKLKSSSTDAIDLQGPAGELISDPSQVAQIFSHFFASVYSIDNGIEPMGEPWDRGILERSIVSPADVLRGLKDTAGKLSAGPDQIPAFFLKRVGTSIAYPLSVLFSWSLTSACVPSQWKTAFVKPLFKRKGSKLSVDNFRPISKISSVGKLLEKIVTKNLMNHFLCNDALSNRQFGFRPKHSTVTQLLSCLDTWTKSLSEKRTTYVCYVDFQKCFDSVVHSKLLVALRSKGIGPRLCAWISSYLEGREQRVQLGEDILSQPAPITSGIIQGSCIGPSLLLALLDPLLDKLNSFNQVEAYGFADDIKIFSESSAQLQLALDELNSWCEIWQLRVSPTKCQILTIGSPDNESFRLGSFILPKVSEARDLGVIVDSSLNFQAHSLSLVKAGRRAAFQTLRCFLSGKVAPLVKAYKTYVLPKLEYASQVCYPQRQNERTAIEKVQRFFTRLVYKKCGKKKASYEQRLRFLKLDSIDVRRCKLDLLLCHRMYHHQTHDCDVLTRSHSLRHQRHNHHLLKDPRGCLARLSFFSNRVVALWNALPERIILSDIDTFKQFIGL